MALKLNKKRSITIDDHSISSFVGDAGYHYPLSTTKKCNMKKFPFDYNEDELIQRLDNLKCELRSDIILPGRKEGIKMDIESGQSHLNYIQSHKMNVELDKIIRNNKKTSRNNYILSILTILIAGIALVNNFLYPKTNENNEIIGKEQLDQLQFINQNLDTITLFLKETKTITK